MIPLRDLGVASSGRPLVTRGVLLANVLAFLLTGAGGGVDAHLHTLRLAAVPANVIGKDAVVFGVAQGQTAGFLRWMTDLEVVPIPVAIEPERRVEYVRRELGRRGMLLRAFQLVEPALPAPLTLLSSMFLHGGWLHLLGNMLFLFVFGPRLEARLGHVRFAAFYLASGALAALTHVAMNATSTVPMVGASGAISGLLGAYVLLWPKTPILALIPDFFLFGLQAIPALFFVAIWVLMQLFLILGTGGARGGGGVAVWAHLGGFVYGLLLIRLFLRPDHHRSSDDDDPEPWLPGRVHRPRRPFGR